MAFIFSWLSTSHTDLYLLSLLSSLGRRDYGTRVENTLGVYEAIIFVSPIVLLATYNILFHQKGEIIDIGCVR